MSRRDRWLTLDEVIQLISDRYPKLLSLQPRAQRQRIRRIVRRVERRDGEQYTKRDGREIVVSRNALESLLAYDAQVYSKLGHDVATLTQNQNAMQRQINGHGARIRVLEEKQKLTAKFLAEYAELDRVSIAS